MLTSEGIVSIVGILVSVTFNYFPSLRVKFAKLQTDKKSLIMIGSMVLVSFAVWGMGCLGWLDPGIACSTKNIPELGKLILIALVSNYTTYGVSPQTKDVKDAKKSAG